MRIDQELIVMPKIFAAEARIEALEELHPLVQSLAIARSFWLRWDALELVEQRDVIEALVVPVVERVAEDERGLRGSNDRRVNLIWR